MAAKYRKIDPRIWDDEVFDGLDAKEAVTAIWCATSKAVNRAGVVVAGLGEIADKCRCNGVDDAWDTVSRVCVSFNWPIAKVGRNTVVIILRTWFRYNEPANPDHLKGMLSDLSDVPRCDLLNQYENTVKSYLSEKLQAVLEEELCPPDDTPGTRCTTPCPTPPPTPPGHQEQESGIRKQELESGKHTAAKFDFAGAFVQFWDVVHLRKGRDAAAKAFRKAVERKGRQMLSQDDAAKYITDAMQEFSGTSEAKPSDRSPIHPSTWLNQGRYDDDRQTWRANGQAVGAGQTYDSNATDFGEGF